MRISDHSEGSVCWEKRPHMRRSESFFWGEFARRFRQNALARYGARTMVHSLSEAELAGQLLTVGFPGTTLPGGVRDALGTGRCAGVIFFKRNLPDLETATELARETKRVACADLPPPIISVDEEGGRVRRLPPPFEGLPAMAKLASETDLAGLEAAGEALGQQLANVGFNLDFAPVLDCNTRPDNPVIGDRAFASDPGEVAACASAFARGMHRARVHTCGKHFPGHGDTDLDSHVALPRILHGRDRLDRVELAPFRALALTMPAMMSAHIIVDALDPALPGTLSSKVSTTLLRDELGFRGVLFSDDLEMGALNSFGDVAETSVDAVRAGCDMLLICSDLDKQERARDALAKTIAAEPAFRARCEEAVRRTHALRRSLRTPDVDEPTLRAARRRCAALRGS